MPMIINAKGAQFWQDVNARLEKVNKTIDEIHYYAPELAITTLKKWRSKGALPAKEHIALIENCLAEWEKTAPVETTEITAGESPMVLNSDENEKLKAQLEAKEKVINKLYQRIHNANKKLRANGLSEVKVDDNDMPVVNDGNERVVELEEMVQARDIEIAELQQKLCNLEQKVAKSQENSSELENLKAQIKEALQEIELLENNLINSQESLKYANEDMEKLKEIAKEYVDDLEERNRVIGVYQREKEMLQKKIEELQQTCDDERKTVNELLVKPSYYLKGGIECKDLIKVMLADVSGIQAFNLGNALKYLWRWQGKNGVEDIAKAITYLEELKNELSEQTTETSEEA